MQEEGEKKLSAADQAEREDLFNELTQMSQEDIKILIK